MKKIILLFFFSIQFIFAQRVVWEDDMEGNNSISGLQSRGWVILNVDGGGLLDPWGQGVPGIFQSFQGADSGYVASSYLGSNSQGIINQWLISPSLTIHAGDSLSFYARAANSTVFQDSINILISSNAGTQTSDFQNLGRFMLDRSSWKGYYIKFAADGTYRYAIAYYMTDSSKANYIGLDNFVLFTNFINYPVSINLNKTFLFNDYTQSSSYRMISLPGISNTSLGSMIAGTQKKDWNGYYDNGSTTNYLDEYDGSSKFTFTPGKGLWVLSKNSINLSKYVNSVTLTSNRYAIPLHSGWNIISNPFEKSVSWSAVQTANGLNANSVIYSWNGSWSNPANMSVYVGYYFNNTQGLSSLSIPYDQNGALGKDNYINIACNTESRSIELNLYDGDNKLSSASISINPKSTYDFDDYDYFAPPGDFDDVRIEIFNSELSTDYKKLFVDTRPGISKGQKFNLNIKNHLNSPVTLNVKGLENFKDYQVYLINNKNSGNYNLKLNNVINIKPSTNDGYSLLIGDDNFIKSADLNLLPKDFCLYQNYPNPFNPNTIIGYSLMTKSHVRIVVYNTLGEVVKDFLNKDQEMGNYSIQFSGESLPSGIYFYKFNALPFDGSKGFHDVKKMLLIK
jgi:hypothetical protein